MYEASCSLDALQTYAYCPQMYAYRWVYRAGEPTQTINQLGRRAIHRSLIMIVRTWLETGPVTLDQAQLMWQFHTRNNALAGNAQWNLKGRGAALRLQEQLSIGAIEPTGIGVPFQHTFEVRPGMQLTVDYDADFTARWRGAETAFRVHNARNEALIDEVAACGDMPWVRYYQNGAIHSFTTPPNPAHLTGLKNRMWQLYRGMARDIVWPQKDQRCAPCTFRDVCQAVDSDPHRLRSAAARKRVRDRIKTERAARA